MSRRHELWRVLVFLWMMHIMDYGERTSFNHPLIIAVAFAAMWLAITGTWLLLRTGWRTDFKRLHRKTRD